MSFLSSALRRLACFLGLSLIVWATASPLPAQRRDVEVVIPPVTAIRPSATVIAIPAFAVRGEGLDASLFHRVIYDDLEIFSDFQRAKDQGFVEETHRRDLASGKVDVAEWRRLECHFLLKGQVAVEQNTLTAEYRLYDVGSGRQVFGLRYRGYPAANPRRLAHRISDDIVERLFDEPGIASTQIVFVSMRSPSRFKEVYLADADGYNPRPLTTDRSLVASPRWGMNGTEIYYTTWREYNPDLCGIQLGTGANWFISRRPTLNLGAAWSQKSQRIAVALARDGNSEIYTMDRSGQERTLRRLTFWPSIEASPTWSPAGNQIAFTSDYTGYPQIWVMDAEGTNPRRLTFQGRYNTSPAWSPKGDRIAFTARDQGRFDIYTMNLDGSGWRQITTGPGNSEDPSWAPDGRHLVFSSNRSGSYQLYIVRDDGSNVRRITDTGSNQSPAWSPGPSSF